MKNKIVIILTLAMVIFLVMGCSLGGATEPTTVVPPDIIATTGALEILSTSSFTDGYGGYYVVGEVMNNFDTPITSIELMISITDSSGASLLKDDSGNSVDGLTFFTLLLTLDTGETSPFSYYFDTTNGIPANYAVIVLSYELGIANRGQLQNENIQIIDDGSGYYALTGELVNQSTDWVHIYGLAGGVLDDTNTILSADWTGTYTVVLAPAGDPDARDRTPFYVSIPVPTIEATQWSVWWDADIATDMTDFPLVVDITNSYFDEYGSAHLVGIVTNNADTALSSQIVAGLYADDGTVLDASYSFLPVPILPGSEVPFDISYFGSVNLNEEQAALVTSYSAQFDPWRTYPPSYENVSLTPVGEMIQKSGSTWTAVGSFTNTTPQRLSGVTIMVAVYDPNNTLVAMGYTYSYPTGDAYAPDDNGSYEITIYLAPGVDTTGYTTHTFVVADVGE